MDRAIFGGNPSSPGTIDERLRFRRTNSAHFSPAICYAEDGGLQKSTNKAKSLKNCTTIGNTRSADCSGLWATPVDSGPIVNCPGREVYQDSPNYWCCEIKGGEPDVLFKRRSASIPSLLSSSDCPVGDAFLDDEDVFECSRRLPVGLQNLGYTCYQNAVVQCLYSTKHLKDYLVSGAYEGLPGMLGVDTLVRRLGKLMTTIAKERYVNVYSSLQNFRTLVGIKLQQFSRVEQHDAQEFLLSLLDRLHCELVEGAKSKTNSWAAFNDKCIAITQRPLQGESFITNLFQGQFCSSVVCSGCGYCSATFEPFTGLSLPIQKFEVTAIQISIVYRTKMADKKNSTHTFYINDKMTAKELKQMISFETGLEESSVLLCDMSKNTFSMLLQDTASAKQLLVCESLHAFEAPSYKGAETMAPILVLLACKVDKRFGHPLVLRVRRNLTQHQFQSVVLNALKEHLHSSPKELSEVISSQVLFQSQVVTNNNKDGLGVLKDDGRGMFHHCTVDAGLLEAEVSGVSPHIRLLAEWNPATMESLFKEHPSWEIPSIAVSVSTRARREKYAFRIALEECIQGYFQKEHVSGVEWKCPRCSCVQSEITKKFDFCTLPKVLIVSVKRFQQHYNRHTNSVVGTKLNTLVEFPLKDLDMSPYMWAGEAVNAGPKLGSSEEDTGSAKEKNTKEKEKKSKFNGKKFLLKLKVNMGKKNSPIANEGETSSSPSMATSNHPVQAQPDSSFSTSKENCLYDLYAVINHKGTMESGHYTATCKSPVGNQWYHCDDNRVKEISQDKVLSENAYILFYARKDSVANGLDSDDQSSTFSSSIDTPTQFHFTIDAHSSSDAESRASISSASKSQMDSRSQSVQSHYLVRPWSTTQYSSSPEPWTPKLHSPKRTTSTPSPHGLSGQLKSSSSNHQTPASEVTPNGKNSTGDCLMSSRCKRDLQRSAHLQIEAFLARNRPKKQEVHKSPNYSSNHDIKPNTGSAHQGTFPDVHLGPVMPGTLV